MGCCVQISAYIHPLRMTDLHDDLKQVLESPVKTADLPPPLVEELNSMNLELPGLVATIR